MFLAGWAVYRGRAWTALGALVLAGLPFLLLRQMVAGYLPSDDGDVVSDQQAGRQALVFYGRLVVVAGVSVLGVVVRWLVGRAPAAELGTPADPGT